MGVDGQERPLHARFQVEILHHEDPVDGQRRQTVRHEAQCDAVQENCPSSQQESVARETQRICELTRRGFRCEREEEQPS